MNNQSQTTTEQPIGVVQSSYTVSITFTTKPSEALRQRLKDTGFKYDKGNWYKTQADGNLATQATIDQLLAA